MAFWVFMLCVDLLLPFTMIGFGRYLRNYPPKEINSVFRYRTRRSMKTMETWNFAQAYFGRLWLIFGCVALPTSVVPMLFFIEKDTKTVGYAGAVICAIQLLFLFFPILLTERALRKKFE